MSTVNKGTKAVVLASAQVAAELKAINGVSPVLWQFQQRNSDPNSPSESFLRAQYKLPTFKKTWAFLNDVASRAQSLRHHPTIVTTYNKVEFEVTTHDVGNRVTERDTQLAAEIQKVYKQHS